jgi:deazaflavin-dependent oxidoreductase (nitroreductase family)
LLSCELVGAKKFNTDRRFHQLIIRFGGGLCGLKIKHQKLARQRAAPYSRPMKLQDGSSLLADLTTVGRKTGTRRTVELRFVYYQGCFYASSSKIQGKHWCQNMLKNPAVEINVKGERFSCTAMLVTDEKLRRHILSLRSSPPLMDRVVFEIKPQ